MILLFFLVLIQILTPSVDCCDTMLLAFTSLRLHPLPVNLISRPLVRQTAPVESRLRNQSFGSDHCNTSSEIGAVREDRQHLLILEGLSAFAINLTEATRVALKSASNSIARVGIVSKPILIGQCPAFEWNHAASEAEKM